MTRIVRGVAMAVCSGSLVIAAAAAQTVIREQAPTDRAVDYSSLDLTRAFAEMDAKQIETLRLLEGGEYNLNIRRLRGAETALVHGKVTDIWVVREGEGVLVTGGELVDPAPASAAGDFRGAGIRGGTRRLIRAGDVVFIPAGVPHGIVESKSITWLNIRFTSR